MIELSDRHVLITGAGGGIGRALVAAFRTAGARVSGFDRSAELMADFDVSDRAAFDLRDGDAARSAAEALCDEAGLPDILVNNAGFTRGEIMPDVDKATWEAELDLNLTGAFNVTDPLLRRMRERRSGTIIFIASVNALLHVGNPAYSAAKAGMLAYCRAIAVEDGMNGIRANAICPGSVRTNAWEHRLQRDPGIMEAAIRFYPLGRLVEPREVADAALFLASPLASGITGAVLPVDAGLTAGNLPFIRDIIQRGM
jgi:NAD(P)-dependent dehydrogenase (short-subunit alcohol dehydrogenase family)